MLIKIIVTFGHSQFLSPEESIKQTMCSSSSECTDVMLVPTLSNSMTVTEMSPKMVAETHFMTIYVHFLCPHLLKAGVGHIAFRRDVTSVCAYVTFITRFKFTCKFICKFRCNFMSAFLLQLITDKHGFKFTCKFRGNFTSAFLLQLITFIPFGLES